MTEYNYHAALPLKAGRFWIFFLIGASVLLVDQWIKSLAYPYFYDGFSVFKNFLGIDFSIDYTTNRGAAWGIFGNYPISLMVFRIGLIFSLVAYVLWFNRHPSWLLPLGLIISGAVGNVLDFFIYGHVIDMFHFVFWGYNFPVFNIADSAISIGIAWLFLLSWCSSSHDPAT